MADILAWPSLHHNSNSTNSSLIETIPNSLIDNATNATSSPSNVLANLTTNLNTVSGSQYLSNTTTTNTTNSTDTNVSSQFDWFGLSKMDNFVDVFSVCCSIAVIFGGLIPYIPQYLKIKQSKNSDGFSTYVCLTLLIANILRIMFWFGHHFELPLLIQSFVMIVGMMAMMEICIRVRNKRSSFTISAIGLGSPTTNRRRRFRIGKLYEFDHSPSPLENRCSREFTPIYFARNSYGVGSNGIAFSSSNSHREHPIRVAEELEESSTSLSGSSTGHDFWDWDDLLSYVKFLSLFTLLISLLTYLLLHSYIYIEILGCVAVLTEAMLGMPQLLRNYSKKSTQGMSVEMVIMWLSGDLFKTLYFIIRRAPAQFSVCGSIQVVVDILILYQVLWYKRPKVTYQKLPEST